MKTVIVLYLPGHAGNFISRLFSLSDETMPLIRQHQLDTLLDQGQALPDEFDRLANYSFSQVTEEFDNWQQFHRSYADFLENTQYRLLNLFCKLKYSRIVLPVHPWEFELHFVPMQNCEFYYVDLDLTKWGSWVNNQKQKLGFQYRGNEHAQFDRLKQNMTAINLTKMLESETAFLQEYTLICKKMEITPMIPEALLLRQDWYSVRVEGQI
jgi:hypothetical protein